MPLRRRLSQAFSRKGSSQTSLQVASSASSHNVQLDTIDEDDLVDTDIIAVVAQSLQEENDTLRRRIGEQQDEQSRLSLQIAQDFSESRREAASLREEIARLERRQREATSKIEELNAKCLSHQKEISEHERNLLTQEETLKKQQDKVQHYERYINSLRKTEQERLHRIQSLEQHARDIEQQLSWANQHLEQPVQDFLKEKAAMSKQNEDMKQLLNDERQKVQRVTCELEALHQTISARESETGHLKATFEAKLAEQKKQLEEAMDKAATLEVHRETLAKEVEQLKNGKEKLRVTPRTILMTGIMERLFPEVAPEKLIEPTRFVDSSTVENLSVKILDMALNADQALLFKESICQAPEEGRIYHSLSLKLCALCQIPKFIPATPESNNRQTVVIINEFPKRLNKMPCCDSAICVECLSKRLLESIKKDWWYNLGSRNWFQCPIATCLQTVPIRHASELTVILTDLGIRDIEEQLQIYAKTIILRDALRSLDPQPSPEALATACKIHKQLVEKGRMYEFFDARFQPSIPDDDGRLQPFKSGKIVLCDIDRGNLTVPIFTKFFRRGAVPRECAVCTDSLYEIDFETEDEWLASCEGFYGPWMWKVLLFPIKATLSCEHEITTCKDCWATHLRSQLEQYGRNGCNRLSCPECSRILSFEELRLYASEETLKQYQHFSTLNLLSAEENFRWCLRESCSNGQLYEETEYLDPRIVCDECSFEMCFTHQMPWHEGYTCEQYDNQREHGDPDYNGTQRYMASNTKRCPGANCGANVEKDGGCFHMTCNSCRHEFCWECLADWTTITSRGQDAHNDGCWFRTGDILPTAIAGNNLQGALRRRNIDA